MERATADAEQTLRLLHKIRRGAEASAPLCFLVHGRAGNFDVMSAFKRAIPEDWTIISVQGFVPDPHGGFSWWSGNEREQEKRRAAIDMAAEKLTSFIAKAKAFYSLTPRTTIAIGFSQGAALLSLVAQRQPALLSGVALLAGFVIQDESHSGALPRFFIGHGTRDEVITFARAEEGVRYLETLGARVTFVHDPVAHKVGSSAIRALKEWIRG